MEARWREGGGGGGATAEHNLRCGVDFGNLHFDAVPFLYDARDMSTPFPQCNE